MNFKKEKRANTPLTESEMFEISDINEFIKKERRHDELSRLYEIRQQKKVWEITVFSCGTIILILLFLAYLGYTQNA